MRKRLSCFGLVAVAAVAGCGGSHRTAPPPRPLLGQPLAQRLAALSDDVANKLAAGDDCGAHSAAVALQHQTMGAIDRRRIPRALQSSLLSAAGDLVDRTHCAATPTPPAEQPNKEHGKGKHEHKGHKHGEGD